MIRFPFSYYGGKILMLNDILPRIPYHKIYVEPFVGGASVFLAKNESSLEIINDKDERITNFYEVWMCPEKLKILLDKLKDTLYSEVNYELADKIMKSDPANYTDIERAWAFFVSINFSYSSIIGGGFRYNLTNKVIQPKQFQRKVERLKNFIDRFKNAIIFNRDAFWVIEKYNVEEAFMFIDPPYYNANMGHYGGYTEDDFKQLLELLSTLKAKFMLTTYPSDILYEYTEQNGWHSEQFDLVSFGSNASKVRHNLSSSKKRKLEVLTMNYTDFSYNNQIKLF